MTENQTFEKIDFTVDTFNLDEYDNCSFINCNFENQNLANFTFVDCEFTDCNFSMVKVPYTAFKSVKFDNCKLLGIDFSECNPFLLDMTFESCIMNLTSFYKLKLKNKKFSNCSLHESDFTETDLSQTIFDNCDLKRAIFNRTILLKTNFSTASNFSISPEDNRLKGAIFSKTNIAGLLDGYKIKII